MQDIPHVAQILLPNWFVEPILTQDILSGSLWQRLLGLVEGAARHGVHKGEGNNRDNHDGEKQATYAPENITSHANSHAVAGIRDEGCYCSRVRLSCQLLAATCLVW